MRDDTRGCWADVLAGDVAVLDDNEGPGTADVEGLRRFLENKVLPWFEDRREEIGRCPLLRDQAFGESLDPDKLSGSAAARCTWTADFSDHGGLSCVGLPYSDDIPVC